MELGHSRHNPNRPPDWRWKRVAKVLDGSMPLSRKRDDRWVTRATQFLLAYDKCTTMLDFARLEDDEPEIYWARMIYLASEDSRRPTRYTIEAYLLTQAPFDYIANRAGIEEGTIKAYEALFFCVRERMKNGQKDWIYNNAITPAIRRGLTMRDYDTLWKIVALQGGQHALERLIQVFDTEVVPSSAADVDAYLDSAYHSWRKTNAFLAQATCQINGFTQKDIFQDYRDWCALEKNNGGGVAGSNAVLAKIGTTLMSSFEFKVGPDKEGLNPRLALADQRAAEPRIDEIMAYSSGQDYEVDAELQTLTFPEQRG